MAKRGPEEEEPSALKAGQRPAFASNGNEDLDFEDEFEDEYESEDEIMEAGIDGRPDAEREAEGARDAMEIDSNEQTFIPGRSVLQPGQTLTPDPSTYEMLHTFSTTWPCLSFDMVRDNLGDNRKQYPRALYAVAGTQAESSKPRDNELMILKLGSLSRMDRGNETGSESESESEDDEPSSSEPILESRSIPLPSTTNRIRAFQPQSTTRSDPSQLPTTLTATNLENGQILIHDITPHLQALSSPGYVLEPSASKPLSTLRMHKSEGYALDWASASQHPLGRLLSGDNDGCIYSTQRTEGGGWVTDNRPLTGHTSSVEEIQWSPNEKNVFASASSDGSVKVWDVRSKSRKPAVDVQISSTDVNVMSWSRLTSHVLATGADDGEWAVWDLRQWKPQQGSLSTQLKPSSVANFKFHKKPITSIEWHPTDDSVVALACADNTVTLWDLGVELDDEEYGKEAGLGLGEGLEKVPPQLLFIHHHEDGKEVHWHPQMPGTIMVTGSSGFGVFKTISDSSRSQLPYAFAQRNQYFPDPSPCSSTCPAQVSIAPEQDLDVRETTMHPTDVGQGDGVERENHPIIDITFDSSSCLHRNFCSDRTASGTANTAVDVAPDSRTELSNARDASVNNQHLVADPVHSNFGFPSQVLADKVEAVRTSKTTLSANPESPDGGPSHLDFRSVTMLGNTSDVPDYSSSATASVRSRDNEAEFTYLDRPAVSVRLCPSLFSSAFDPTREFVDPTTSEAATHSTASQTGMDFRQANLLQAGHTDNSIQGLSAPSQIYSSPLVPRQPRPELRRSSDGFFTFATRSEVFQALLPFRRRSFLTPTPQSDHGPHTLSMNSASVQENRIRNLSDKQSVAAEKPRWWRYLSTPFRKPERNTCECRTGSPSRCRLQKKPTYQSPTPPRFSETPPGEPSSQLSDSSWVLPVSDFGADLEGQFRESAHAHLLDDVPDEIGVARAMGRDDDLLVQPQRSKDIVAEIPKSGFSNGSWHYVPHIRGGARRNRDRARFYISRGDDTPINPWLWWFVGGRPLARGSVPITRGFLRDWRRRSEMTDSGLPREFRQELVYKLSDGWRGSERPGRMRGEWHGITGLGTGRGTRVPGSVGPLDGGVRTVSPQLQDSGSAELGQELAGAGHGTGNPPAGGDAQAPAGLPHWGDQGTVKP